MIFLLYPLESVRWVIRTQKIIMVSRLGEKFVISCNFHKTIIKGKIGISQARLRMQQLQQLQQFMLRLEARLILIILHAYILNRMGFTHIQSF